MNIKTLLKDKRFIAGIVVVVIIAVVVGFTTHRNKVLTKENLDYQIVGSNGSGRIVYGDKAEETIATKVAEEVGKKTGLSDKQIKQLTTDADPDEVMDGSLAGLATLFADSDYAPFGEAISKDKVTSELNGKAVGETDDNLDLYTGGSLKNGDKVTIKLTSPSGKYQIPNEMFTIKVKGLK